MILIAAIIIIRLAIVILIDHAGQRYVRKAIAINYENKAVKAPINCLSYLGL
jgi:hypothetical protein